MSLPSGLANRPSLAAHHPAVIGGLWRVALRAMLVLLPIVAQAAMLAPGNRWQMNCSDLEEEINAARRERRQLVAERAALLDPTRLRREARRLGLVPSVPGSDTIELHRANDGIAR